MANPWKEKVLKYNRQKAQEKQKADDLMMLLNALPPGQVKQLMKDEACRKVLEKYGFGIFED